MDKLDYHFNGEIYSLTSKERKPFDNNDPLHRVSHNSLTLFKLKSGEMVEGVPIDIQFLYPEGGTDCPLQSIFTIKQKDNTATVILNFTQIESHEPIIINPNPIIS